MSLDIDLSIIIINWKSADFLRRCLTSICANVKNIKFEIIVVDNASFDGSEEMVQRLFPEVHFTQSEKNLGFAKANNLGFRAAKGRNILFLNPDTEIVGSAISLMISSLESLAEAGVVGCRLLNSDHSIQMSCVQRFPSILNQVLDADYLRELFPRLKLWGTQPLIDSMATLAQVEVISGACLMIRRDAFEQVGQFTTGYFMYSEDVDLCYKVRQAGMKSYYVGTASVIHHGGRSSEAKQQNHFTAVMMRQSRLNFFRERQGRFYASLYRLCTAGAAICRMMILSFTLLVTIGRYHRAPLCWSLGKWSRVFCWALGLEAWARTPN